MEISTPELVDFLNADTDGTVTFLLFAVDGSDISLHYASRSTADGPRLSMTEAPPCPGDINCDGVVDVEDLVEVILNWGTCFP